MIRSDVWPASARLVRAGAVVVAVAALWLCASAPPPGRADAEPT